MGRTTMAKHELRRGWTTGACATAAVKAAYGALLTGAFQDPVTISLPGGEMPFPPDYPKMPGEPPRVQPSKKVAAHWDEHGNRIED